MSEGLGYVSLVKCGRDVTGLYGCGGEGKGQTLPQKTKHACQKWEVGLIKQLK